MKKIKLTSGKFALVDDDMFEELNKFSWCLNGGYAIRGYSKNGKQAKLKMHRVIMNTPKGMDTDHIDNNKLNNQRNNLRVCTRSQNCMNRKKRSTPNLSSSFKGVSIRFKNKPWKSYFVQVSTKTKRLHKIFPFTTEGEIQAAKYYNKLALKHYGEFANLNKV